MRSLLSFTNKDLEDQNNPMVSPMGEDLRTKLRDFHAELLKHSNHPPPEEDEAAKLEEALAEKKQLSWTEKILALVSSKQDDKPSKVQPDGPGKKSLQGSKLA
jgi:hypothetical protein